MASFSLRWKGPVNGLQAGPEKAVMDEEQIGADGNRLFHDGKMGIDGGGDPGDLSGVFKLEAVERARVIRAFLQSGAVDGYGRRFRRARPWEDFGPAGSEGNWRDSET